MDTKIIRWRSHADDDALIEAAEALKNGALVAFPTETVYGLGANALNPDACRAIYEAKGRPSDNPLIVHVDSPSKMLQYAEPENPALFDRLAAAFMPGPLTVVLKKKKIVPDAVTASLPTVALRCPIHPAAHTLLRLADVPVAAPSANTSGRPSPTAAEHVLEDLYGKVPYIIDGGSCDVGLESTIVLPHANRNTLTLLRPGGVTPEELLTVCDHLEFDKALTGVLKEGEQPLAPGMKYRHYAPKAPVTGVVGSDENVLAFLAERLAEGCGVLCFDEDVKILGASKRLAVLGGRWDYAMQARELFSKLRFFDSSDVTAIFTRLPEDDLLGLAVKNRLLKACGFSVLEV